METQPREGDGAQPRAGDGEASCMAVAYLECAVRVRADGPRDDEQLVTQLASWLPSMR